jgi:hypothetical protein
MARPKFVPTEEQRRTVKTMAAYGINHAGAPPEEQAWVDVNTANASVTPLRSGSPRIAEKLDLLFLSTRGMNGSPQHSGG